MAKLAFLQNSWIELIGPMIISAVLKKNGHSCEVFIGNKKNIFKDILNYNPDVIAFSCTTGQHKWAVKMSRAIRNELNFSGKILIGGPHPTFFPEVINQDSIDIICRGEGEGAILDLMNNLGGNITKIKNLWVKENGKIHKNELRPLVENLDELPIADRSIYYKYKFLGDNPVKTIMASRGCPYNCSFCFNHTLKKMYEGKGRYLRCRSVENVIKELKHLKENYKVKIIKFYDDTFTLHRKWLFEFLDEYKREIGLPFICLIRLDLEDEEVISKLKEAGCFMVMVGLESGCEKIRNEVLRKNLTDEQIFNTSRLLKKYKLKFCSGVMVGVPGETLDDVYKTIRLNQRIKADDVYCSVFQPYPRTDLAEYSVKLGYVDKIDVENIGGSYQNSVLKNKDMNKIINLSYFFYLAVKLPFLMPVINLLIKFPPNRLFFFIQNLAFSYSYYKRSNISFFRLLREILYHHKYHLGDSE